MKPALVLGLALAANAMVADQGDNELIMAPTDKFSRDLVQRFPGKIMFDEVADDELSLMPIPPKFVANYDWVKSVKIPTAEARRRDDEADDELAIMLLPRKAFKSEEEYQKYYARARYTADDEFLISPPRDFSRYGFDANGHVLRDNIGRPVKPVLARFDEIADDELAMRNPTPEQYQRLQNKNLLYKDADDQLWDEAADDELGLKIVHFPVAPAPEIAAYDDDEFAAAVFPRSAFKTDKEYQEYVQRMRYYRDDAADDELGLRVIYRPAADNHPYSFDDDNLFKKSKEERKRDGEYVASKGWVNPAQFDDVADDELRIRPISVLPESVAADDGLSFMPIPPKVFANRDWVKPTKLPLSEALIRDDEADDELAYLGKLIGDGGYIPRPRTFDDKLRAEKPSHVKAEERAQMKKELPKRQKKLRPHPDVIPMAENQIL